MPRVQVRAAARSRGTSTRSPRRDGDARDIESIGERLRDVTDQNRCFLGEEEQRVIAACCARSPRTSPPSSKARRRSSALPVPKIVDIHDGVAIYDEKQMRKQPDWTYAPL